MIKGGRGIVNIGRKTLIIEKLGANVCSELYDMRSVGMTYKDCLTFLYSKGIEDVSKKQLMLFFQRYNLIAVRGKNKKSDAEKLAVRKYEMSRRIDFVSGIIERQIEDLYSNEEIDGAVKSKRISELCAIMLETVSKDVSSQVGFDKKEVGDTNVQVNIGDQLKRVADRKESLKKEILSAKYADVEVITKKDVVEVKKDGSKERSSQT